MPIYEYKCKACEERFDLMRSVAQINAPAPCPACASPETMRLLSLFAARTGGPEPCATSQMAGDPCCRIAPGGG